MKYRADNNTTRTLPQISIPIHQSIHPSVIHAARIFAYRQRPERIDQQLEDLLVSLGRRVRRTHRLRARLLLAAAERHRVTGLQEASNLTNLRGVEPEG